MKSKKIASDLLYSIFAIGIMNVVLQFVVYPFINRQMGAEVFGQVLFYQGIIAILAPSFGNATNNTRLVIYNRDTTKNGDYIFTLLLVSIPASVISVIVCILQHDTVLFSVLFIILVIISIFRNYSSVEYRLTLTYKKQFVFFMVLSVGYLVGILLFKAVHSWIAIFLLAEAAAVAFVIIFGTIYKQPLVRSKRIKQILKHVITLSASYLLTNGMLNLDRLVLKYFVGSEAVSEYYVLSLLGKTVAIIGVPLNSILIGYLTKRETKLTRKPYMKITAAIAAFGVLVFAACCVLTPVFIRIIYPSMVSTVDYSLNTWVCAAQILYFLTNILLVVVLTFVEVRWQLIIQGSYAVLFVILSILMTRTMMIRGFAYAACISSLVYFLMTIIVGLIGSTSILTQK